MLHSVLQLEKNGFPFSLHSLTVLHSLFTCSLYIVIHQLIHAFGLWKHNNQSIKNDAFDTAALVPEPHLDSQLKQI